MFPSTINIQMKNKNRDYLNEDYCEGGGGDKHVQITVGAWLSRTSISKF